MAVKRYAVFAGSFYYPAGGWNDFSDSFDSLDEALAATKAEDKSEYRWAQVVDLQTGKIVTI